MTNQVKKIFKRSVIWPDTLKGRVFVFGENLHDRNILDSDKRDKILIFHCGYSFSKSNMEAC